jgi:hypothetical protein
MKRPSWTYPTIKKHLTTACAAGLLLLTLSATTAFGNALLTFDSLVSSSAVPGGYGDLNWENFYALDAVNYGTNPSGYLAGMKSANNVLYNGGGSPARIYAGPGGSFIPLTAYATAAWNDNLRLQVEGYLRGRRVFSFTYKLSATRPTLIKLGGQKVDELVFNSYGGTDHAGYPGSGRHIALDNVSIKSVNRGTPVPAIVPEFSSKDTGAADSSPASE